MLPPRMHNGRCVVGSSALLPGTSLHQLHSLALKPVQNPSAQSPSQWERHIHTGVCAYADPTHTGARSPCRPAGTHPQVQTHSRTLAHTHVYTHLYIPAGRPNRCTLTPTHLHAHNHTGVHTDSYTPAHKEMHIHQALWVEAAEIWGLWSEVKPQLCPLLTISLSKSQGCDPNLCCHPE